MKFCAIAAVLLVSLFATSLATPAYKRVAHYKRPQRMVLQQYVQHPRTHARSAAYVAGDSVAADCVHPEDVGSVKQQVAGDSNINDAGINADAAYPAAGGQVSAEFEGTFSESSFDAGVSGGVNIPAGEVPASSVFPGAPVVDNQVLEDDSAPGAPAADNSDHDSKVPREYNFETPAEVAPEAPISEEATPAFPEVSSVYPAQVPAEVAPAKRYLPPSKKVTVNLDEQSEAADDDADIDVYHPARIPNARRPVKKGNGSAVAAKGTKAQLPAGTFFPVTFGGTSGGAIAIANSFSTGEGGSATSHAIAYGSPEAARTKSRPVRRH